MHCSIAVFRMLHSFLEFLEIHVWSPRTTKVACQEALLILMVQRQVARTRFSKSRESFEDDGHQTFQYFPFTHAQSYALSTRIQQTFPPCNSRNLSCVNINNEYYNRLIIIIVTLRFTK